MILKIYLSSLLISFLCSLISFRLHYPFHLRIFSVLLGITVITEFFANFGMQLLWDGTNNMMIYSVFRLFEYTGMAFYYRQIIKNKVVRKIIGWFLVLYPLYWFITVFYIFRISSWASYLPIVGSPFTVLFSVVLCYELFISPELIDFKKCSELWIALGLIIYYTCDLPYEGMLNFLWTNYPLLAKQVVTILDILNTITYSLITYAFLCRINTRKS